MLPIKKIYIDSRFKSADSRSDSDFYVTLPQNMLMPDGCGFYLDDISIPVSWYTIGKDINDRLYYRVNGSAGFVVVPEGNYSLVDLNSAIVDELNKVFANYFVSDPSVKTDTIGIRTKRSISFAILTDAELDSAGFSSTNPRSINKVLRNSTPKVKITVHTCLAT